MNIAYLIHFLFFVLLIDLLDAYTPIVRLFVRPAVKATHTVVKATESVYLKGLDVLHLSDVPVLQPSFHGGFIPLLMGMFIVYRLMMMTFLLSTSAVLLSANAAQTKWESVGAWVTPQGVIGRSF